MHPAWSTSSEWQPACTFKAGRAAPMMTAVIHESLDTGAMDLLAGYRGPCLTIAVPGFRSGAAHEASRQVHFHNAVRMARDKLAAAGFTREAGAILEPIEEAAREREEAPVPG